MAVKYNVIRDNGSRILEVMVEGAPDITTDQSYISKDIRPIHVELYYTSTGMDPWVLTKATVFGLPVNKSGETNSMTSKRHRVVYPDVHGKGGISMAVTPEWLVDMAKKYTDPDKLPRTS
jgi:hypothetical protein